MVRSTRLNSSLTKEVADARYSRIRPALRGMPLCAGFRATGVSAAQATAQTVQDTLKWSGVVGFDASDIRVVYANWRTNTYLEGTSPYEDVIPEAAMTLRAGLVVNGVTYALYVNGKRDFVVDPGGFVETDPLPLEVKAGDIIRTVTYQAAGTWRVWAAIQNPALGGDGAGITTTGDFTGELAAQLSDGGGSGVAPAAITGTPKNRRQRTVCLVGASDMEGVGDGVLQNGFNMAITNLRDGSWGWAVRGLRGKTGIIQTARTGDRVSKFILPAGHKRRMMFASSCSDLITTMGLNDVFNSATLAQLKTDKIAEWLLEAQRCDRVWQTTWTPNTTSSDDWTTTAGQTVAASEAVRTGFNDWVRDGAPLNYPALTGAATGVAPGAGIVRAGMSGHPLYDFLEVADCVESARNSGKWRVDGIETTTGSMTSGSNVLTLPRAVVAADRWKLVQIPAGAGGIMIRGYISVIAGNTGTLVTTSGTAVNAAITVSSVATKLALPTVDGLHGTADMHEKIKSDLAARFAAILTE
jgi:hypothetical protein